METQVAYPFLEIREGEEEKTTTFKKVNGMGKEKLLYRPLRVRRRKEKEFPKLNGRFMVAATDLLLLSLSGSLTTLVLF